MCTIVQLYKKNVVQNKLKFTKLLGQTKMFCRLFFDLLLTVG